MIDRKWCERTEVCGLAAGCNPHGNVKMRSEKYAKGVVFPMSQMYRLALPTSIRLLVSVSCQYVCRAKFIKGVWLKVRLQHRDPFIS
jgi:hypothetical protein